MQKNTDSRISHQVRLRLTVLSNGKHVLRLLEELRTYRALTNIQPYYLCAFKSCTDFYENWIDGRIAVVTLKVTQWQKHIRGNLRACLKGICKQKLLRLYKLCLKICIVFSRLEYAVMNYVTGMNSCQKAPTSIMLLQLCQYTGDKRLALCTQYCMHETVLSLHSIYLQLLNLWGNYVCRHIHIHIWQISTEKSWSEQIQYSTCFERELP